GVVVINGTNVTVEQSGEVIDLDRTLQFGGDRTETVTLLGGVIGDIDVTADRIEVGPTGSLEGGDVNLRGGEFVNVAGSVAGGEIDVSADAVLVAGLLDGQGIQLTGESQVQISGTRCVSSIAADAPAISVTPAGVLRAEGGGSIRLGGATTLSAIIKGRLSAS